jgi:hypothetical protein
VTLVRFAMVRDTPLFAAWAVIALLTTLLGTSVSLPDKRSAASRLIALPISKKSRGLSKRDDVPVDLSNQGYFYSVNIGVGSPPQSIDIELDTGSSDTWVFTPSSCGSVQCAGGSCT